MPRIQKNSTRTSDSSVRSPYASVGPLATPPGCRIKRPLNPWILFRKAATKDWTKWVGEDDWPAEKPLPSLPQMSKILGRIWKRQSNEEKAEFVREAERNKLEHSERFPNYKYCPINKEDKKRAREAQKLERQQRKQEVPRAARQCSVRSRFTTSTGATTVTPESSASPKGTELYVLESPSTLLFPLVADENALRNFILDNKAGPATVGRQETIVIGQLPSFWGPTSYLSVPSQPARSDSYPDYREEYDTKISHPGGYVGHARQIPGISGGHTQARQLKTFNCTAEQHVPRFMTSQMTDESVVASLASTMSQPREGVECFNFIDTVFDNGPINLSYGLPAYYSFLASQLSLDPSTLFVNTILEPQQRFEGDM